MMTCSTWWKLGSSSIQHIEQSRAESNRRSSEQQWLAHAKRYFRIEFFSGCRGWRSHTNTITVEQESGEIIQTSVAQWIIQKRYSVLGEDTRDLGFHLLISVFVNNCFLRNDFSDRLHLSVFEWLINTVVNLELIQLLLFSSFDSETDRIIPQVPSHVAKYERRQNHISCSTSLT